VLGEYSQAALSRMPVRELKRRYCDVFEMPAPPKALNNERWLRARLAAHATDEAAPGAYVDRYATDEDDDSDDADDHAAAAAATMLDEFLPEDSLPSAEWGMHMNMGGVGEIDDVAMGAGAGLRTSLGPPPEWDMVGLYSC
jgi:hypothetical protein